MLESTHLLELIHVDIELISKLSFRLGKSLYLRLEVSGFGRLSFCVLLFSFVSRHMVLDLKLLGPH
jgi:hypothetical protein